MSLPLVDVPARRTCACSSAASQALRSAVATASCCEGTRVAPRMHLDKGMNGHATDPMNDSGTSARWLRWGLGVFVAVALFFLWTEHRAHLLGVLPWLLLLACPLMHMLMHRRHGGHHHSGVNGSTDAKKEHEHGGHGCC
jgi:hypothetical protein